MNKVAIIATSIALTLSASAYAEDEVTINQSFKIENQQELSIDFSVGAIEVRTYKGDTVEVDIELKQEKSGFSFFGGTSLDDIDLDVKDGEQRLSLRINEDDINQTWVVKVPEGLDLDIDLGVGDVQLMNISDSVRVDVGVGAAQVELSKDDYRRIELESGVGDTSILGFGNSVIQERQIVTSSSLYRGQGEHSIRIDVGVGDAKVRL